MRARDWKASDIPHLRKMYEDGGYQFDFPDPCDPNMEDVVVIEDALGRPILVGYAKRSVEMIMMVGRDSPTVKIQAIAKLHEEMRQSLTKKGYEQAFAVVTPRLGSYIRKMVKLFGWRADYQCFRIFG